MAILREYSCDLCDDRWHAGTGIKLIGLRWGSMDSRSLEAVDNWRDSEHHICHRCLSALQSFEKVCGDGFECSGGPRCPSDHK